MRIPEGQKNLKKPSVSVLGLFLTRIPALWAGDLAYRDL